MHQVGEEANDLALKLVGVAAEVTVVEGVSDVVGAVAEEGQQRRVVEVLVAGIADEPVSQLLEVAQERVEPLLGPGTCFHCWPLRAIAS